MQLPPTSHCSKFRQTKLTPKFHRQSLARSQRFASTKATQFQLAPLLQLSEQQVGQVFSQRLHQRPHLLRNPHLRQRQSRNLHQRLSRNQRPQLRHHPRR
jgi:hypothetical protein